MSDYEPSDTDQQIAALMLASSGLTPADIARTLGVHESQVRQWLQQPAPDRRRKHDEQG